MNGTQEERLNMKLISIVLRKDRAIQDEKNVKVAKKKYKKFDFTFTYKKGEQVVVMTNT